MKLRNKKKINDNKYILNNQEINKLDVIKFLSRWANETFIFHNRQVRMPIETELPVKNVDEELIDLNNFDKTNMGALEYLIICVLSVGIKIGREMEKNERDEE